MWEINNTSQVLSFIYALVLGVIFAMFYDLFRSIRIVKKHNTIAVFIEDIFFFVIISIVTFIYFLSITAGEIRAYILVGIALGFLLFFITASKYFIKLISFFLKGVLWFFNIFRKWFYLIFNKIDCFIMFFSKNSLKCFKKGLKMIKGLLYTNRK